MWDTEGQISGSINFDPINTNKQFNNQLCKYKTKTPENNTSKLHVLRELTLRNNILKILDHQAHENYNGKIENNNNKMKRLVQQINNRNINTNIIYLPGYYLLVSTVWLPKGIILEIYIKTIKA